MNKKYLKRSIVGFLGLIVIFISIMTWLYPYSPFSLQKQFTYEPYFVSGNDGTFDVRLQKFKDSYKEDLEADMENKYPNLTINQTEAIFITFDQKWLTERDPISFNTTVLSDMLFEVRQVKEMLLSLIVKIDYTSEQREYLVGSFRKFLGLEESINEVKDEPYIVRSELERRFDNLYVDYLNAFSSYVTFYESVVYE
ncbi:hypothetical protein [Ornithinibacillus halophilus]|uniref:Uncharacterized protein n=1 Tax=Ornithinibacillus halophilus TaxID=930117 RepID=A0A1M5N511_9BACI|nr:hypothetical protein [Ornithinibacillus halophilus]SHG84601.1 hypothetical protein SAMN05216225_107010 [Ornithinibacillus halophilus]